jgi:hypothetical protein
MAVIPNGFAQANFRYSGGGFPEGAEWTLGLDVSGAIGGPVGVATDLLTNYTATIRTVLPAATVLTSVLVKFGPNDLGPSGEVAGSYPGTGGGVQTSSAVAILVRKVTSIGGRPGRGRFFLPGVQESEVDAAGILTTGFVDGLQDEMDNFYAELVSSAMPPVLLHSETSPLSTPTVITSFQVDARVATQRRRQRR